MTLPEFIKQCEERLTAATPGPWYYQMSLTDEEAGIAGGVEPRVVSVEQLDGETDDTFLICAPDTCRDQDAEFIAAAPATERKLIDIVKTLLEVAKNAYCLCESVHLNGTLIRKAECTRCEALRKADEICGED